MASPNRFLSTVSSINEDLRVLEHTCKGHHSDRSVSPDSFIPLETRPNTSVNQSCFTEHQSYFGNSSELPSQLAETESAIAALNLEIQFLKNQNDDHISHMQRVKAEFAQEVLNLKTNHEYKVESLKAKYDRKLHKQEKEYLNLIKILSGNFEHENLALIRNGIQRTDKQRNFSFGDREIEDCRNETTNNKVDTIAFIKQKLKNITAGKQNDKVEDMLVACINRIE